MNKGNSLVVQWLGLGAFTDNVYVYVFIYIHTHTYTIYILIIYIYIYIYDRYLLLLKLIFPVNGVVLAYCCFGKN